MRRIKFTSKKRNKAELCWGSCDYFKQKKINKLGAVAVEINFSHFVLGHVTILSYYNTIWGPLCAGCCGSCLRNKAELCWGSCDYFKQKKKKKLGAVAVEINFSHFVLGHVTILSYYNTIWGPLCAGCCRSRLKIGRWRYRDQLFSHFELGHVTILL